ELRKGQEVILNEAFNVIEARGFDGQGEVVRLKDLLEGRRALVTLHFDEEKVAELGEPLLEERLSVGDHLLYDPRSGYVIEKCPTSAMTTSEGLRRRSSRSGMRSSCRSFTRSFSRNTG